MKKAAAGALLLMSAPMLFGCGGEPEAEAESASPSSSPEPEAGTENGSGKKSPSPSAPPSIEVPSLPVAKDRGIVEGGDLSWPQCPKGMGIKERRTLGLPKPLDSAEYVVIGLTNGPAFTPNPCLADQVEWAKD